MSDDPIKPIETRYAGCRFRSRLEARWAVFFDALQIPWEYEPQGFTVGREQVAYLPDFHLPRHGAYLEIKPAAANLVDPDGVHRWDEFAGEVYTEWEDGRTFMLIGPIPDPAKVGPCGPPSAENWYDPGIVITGDWHYAWCACPSGQHFDIQFEARGGRILCGCPRALNDQYRTGDHWRLLQAYGEARTARFEHGQAPGMAA